jgi:hypothetical protein
MQNKDIQEFIEVANQLDLDCVFGPDYIWFEGRESEAYEGSPFEWQYHAQRNILNGYRYGMDGLYTWEAPVSQFDSILSQMREAIEEKSTTVYVVATCNNKITGRRTYPSLTSFFDDDDSVMWFDPIPDDSRETATMIRAVAKREYDMSYDDLVKSLDYREAL